MDEIKSLEAEKIKVEIEKLKAETEKVVSEKGRIESERDKYVEDLKQSQVPYWRRPAYLSIFLPVVTTLIIGYLNFSKIRDDDSAKKIKELNQKIEESRNQALDLERKQIQNAVLEAEKAKSTALQDRARIEAEKNNLTLINNQLSNEAKRTQDKINSVEIKLKDLNKQNANSRGKIDSLNAVLNLSSIDNQNLIAQIARNKNSLDSLDRNFRNLDARANMISLLSIKLKSLLVRIYTNWNRNGKNEENNNLANALESIRNELRNQFSVMENRNKYEGEFNRLDRSISDLLETPSAFKKANVLDNNRFVKNIDSDTDDLIKALQKLSN